MPIFLRAPAHNPAGPDGQGWNRLSIWSPAGDECALRPHSYAALIESQDTRHARYGGFGACIRQGQCDGCPIRTRPVRELHAFTDRVLARISPSDGHPWLMNHPDKGWASFGYRWTWEDVARVPGWTIGDRHVDQHGDGFWLVRAEPQQASR